jgi:predicted RNA-binding Zn ribbon-like protein
MAKGDGMVQGRRAVLVADALALDFLNTVATPVDVTIDLLETGAGLMSWLRQRGLVSEDGLNELESRGRPEALDRAADQARSLREWFRGFVAERKGEPLTLTDLQAAEKLNELLKRDDRFSAIVGRDQAGVSPLRLRTMRREDSSGSLLVEIAEVLARFICEEDFTNVKLCEGTGCTLFFADHTRGRYRRWCSMAMCGNRAKQAAHRSRAKSQSLSLVGAEADQTRLADNG